MTNYDHVTKENIKQHNPNWPHIPDYPCRILVTDSSKSRKMIILFNLIRQQNS